MSSLCPCGTGRPEATCCGPFRAGVAHPATAEELMRSRYTAYARGDVDYLLATHHPSTRPDRAGVARSAATAEFTRLVIHEAGEDWVRFDAHYRPRPSPEHPPRGPEQVLRERSRFQREAGRWLYLDGDVTEATVSGDAPGAPSRNGLCPCGSGKKYKRCHGADR